MSFLTAITLIAVVVCSCCLGDLSYSHKDYIWNNLGTRKHGEACLLPYLAREEIELDVSLTEETRRENMTNERCNVKLLLQCLPAELDEYAISTEDPANIREGTCQCTMATGGKLSVVHPTKGCRIPAGKMGMSSCLSSEPLFKAANFNTTEMNEGACTENAECRRDGSHPHYWCHCRIGFTLEKNGQCSDGRRQARVSVHVPILLGFVAVLGHVVCCVVTANTV